MEIFFIGAGNVAHNMAINFYKNGHNIKGIYSRSDSAKKLAKLVKAKSFNKIPEIDSDIIILAVPDDKIRTIASQSNLKGKTLVHTAGSVSSNILSPFTNKYGVLYPLQTLNKKTITDFREVPLCITASNNFLNKQLKILGKSVNSTVFEINDEQRLKMHIAAVFVNNFTNHIITLANIIAENEHINKDILKPLLKKTFENAIKYKAKEIQTGPARRKDQNTLQKHIAILKNYPPEFLKVYESISRSIQKMYE